MRDGGMRDEGQRTTARCITPLRTNGCTARRPMPHDAPTSKLPGKPGQAQSLGKGQEYRHPSPLTNWILWSVILYDVDFAFP